MLQIQYSKGFERYLEGPVFAFIHTFSTFWFSLMHRYWLFKIALKVRHLAVSGEGIDEIRVLVIHKIRISPV